MLCQCCQCSASVARYIHRIVCCVSVVVSCGYCGSIVSRECCVCGAGSSLSHTPTQVTTHEAIKYFITDTRGSCTRARRDEHHDQARTKERSRVRGPVPRVRVNQRIQARVRRLLRKWVRTVDHGLYSKRLFQHGIHTRGTHARGTQGHSNGDELRDEGSFTPALRRRRLLTQRWPQPAARHCTQVCALHVFVVCAHAHIKARNRPAVSTCSRPARLLLDRDALHTAATRHTAPRVRRAVRLSRPPATDAEPAAIPTALLCAQLLSLLSHLGRVGAKG